MTDWKLPHTKEMAKIASQKIPPKNRKTMKVVMSDTKAEAVMKQAKKKQLMVRAGLRPNLLAQKRP